MEDGPDGPQSDVEMPDAELPDALKTGAASPPIVPKPPEEEQPKLNGETASENNLYDDEDDSYSSESDALVIDESVPKKQKGKKGKLSRRVLVDNLRKVGESEEREDLEEEGQQEQEQQQPQQESPEEQQSQQEQQELSPSCLFAQTYASPPALTHSNPYFNESLFELSQLHHNPQLEDNQGNSKSKSKKGKAKPKPRLREYAQYLGLQPAVQFKCSKCNRAGFESFASLQEHSLQCNSENVQRSPENSSSGFKLTRKVFLCSACGTYYENWNLYMHMLEFHKRFICLYCLGMFSVLEDLCQHIQSRHNFEPGYKNSLDEFFNVFNEPCYVVCCECNKLFSEQDNFFYHNCSKNKGKKPVGTKPQITPENHVTGESETLDKEVEDINNVNIDDEKPNDDNSTENNNKDSNDTSTLDDDSCQNPTDNNDDDKTDETKTDPSENVNTIDDMNLTTEPNNDHNDPTPEEVPMEIEDGNSTETRKVPKLSLKLPKFGTVLEEDSDDSEKLTMETEQVESDNEDEGGESGDVKGEREQEQAAGVEKGGGEGVQGVEQQEEEEEEGMKIEEEPQVAGSDVPIIELQLEQPLDKFDPRVLLQKCLKTTVPTCIFCNHARKISVNGKQLALHCMAEHRFSAVVNSITAEELIPENFVNRLKESLEELDKSFFNLECSFTDEAITFSHVFECFQCYFSTSVHKELYLHNRKFHSKNLLLCIMCKSNFYSYSELVCHLCPGLYVLDYDLEFRCCMCVNDDLPSSFRLMVHLRKKHNVCDVCLEMCHTQYRLSNHVWKHKLHHFCYRCCIAYRNKPDITRHLFWKHGTESVLCKRCLQKKWPHVYHFCMPPASFTCEECNLSFTRAVSLKVHKRIHSEEKKHECTWENCQEKFISKKLLVKHEKWHLEPPKEEKSDAKVEDSLENQQKEEQQEESKNEDKLEDKLKPKIDVLDLPALNLSESDSSDSEPESNNKPNVTTPENPENTTNTEEESHKEEKEELLKVKAEPEADPPVQENKGGDKPVEAPPVDEIDSSHSVIQNIWDNFKNYQASKEKIDNLFSTEEKSEEKPPEDVKPPEEILPETSASEVVLLDHDYCVNPEKTTDSSIIEVKPALTLSDSVDHDYCSPKPQTGSTGSDKPETSTAQPNVLREIQLNQQPQKPENKKADSSSSSSSDTDSSCSCGSNCSCSSSSGSSSSSSDSSNSDSSTEEGRKRQLARRQKRKERAKKMKEGETGGTAKKHPDPVVAADPALIDAPIRESDLETTESETDEEFYDRAPQKLAKKIIEEKRQQLLATVGPNSFPNGSFIESTSRPPTPPAGLVEEERKKSKKSKSKKRKKKKSERARDVVEEPGDILTADVPIPPYYQQFHQQQQLLVQPTAAAPAALSRDSPAGGSPPMTPTAVAQPYGKTERDGPGRRESSDTSLRASKRRRVPNKFYGYSSDEDAEKASTPKWRKTEASSHTPRSPLIVPPITIKATPQPPPPPPPQVVEPISIRTAAHLSDFRVRRPKPRPSAVPPLKLLQGSPDGEMDSGTESNDSSSEEQNLPPKPAQPQLYCYCRCPYDEVSEMIGCDASDCAIEWFHFECVGIMVPPKGQWFCPDCRKKKQQRREMLLQQQQQQAANRAFEHF